MPQETLRLSDHSRVVTEDEETILQFREETRRGGRYGMSRAIPLSQDEAETFAKWVFAREFDG